jgi:phosphatidylglycerophosphate synthase
MPLARSYAARDLLRVPGLLSLTRIPLAVAFAFTVERPGWSIALLVLAGLTDVADGWYARRFGEATPTGAVLDGVMDKFFVLAVVVTLVVAKDLTIVEALLLSTRDLGEIGIALAWIRKSGGRERSFLPAANRAGKLATFLQFAAVVAVLLGTPYRMAWIGTAAACGAVAAVTYAVRESRSDRLR